MASDGRQALPRDILLVRSEGRLLELFDRVALGGQIVYVGGVGGRCRDRADPQAARQL